MYADALPHAVLCGTSPVTLAYPWGGTPHSRAGGAASPQINEITAMAGGAKIAKTYDKEQPLTVTHSEQVKASSDAQTISLCPFCADGEPPSPQ